MLEYKYFSLVFSLLFYIACFGQPKASDSAFFYKWQNSNSNILPVVIDMDSGGHLIYDHYRISQLRSSKAHIKYVNAAYQPYFSASYYVNSPYSTTHILDAIETSTGELAILGVVEQREDTKIKHLFFTALLNKQGAVLNIMAFTVPPFNNQHIISKCQLIEKTEGGFLVLLSTVSQVGENFAMANLLPNLQVENSKLFELGDAAVGNHFMGAILHGDHLTVFFQYEFCTTKVVRLQLSTGNVIKAIEYTYSNLCNRLGIGPSNSVLPKQVILFPDGTLGLKIYQDGKFVNSANFGAKFSWILATMDTASLQLKQSKLVKLCNHCAVVPITNNGFNSQGLTSFLVENEFDSNIQYIVTVNQSYNIIEQRKIVTGIGFNALGSANGSIPSYKINMGADSFINILSSSRLTNPIGESHIYRYNPFGKISNSDCFGQDTTGIVSLSTINFLAKPYAQELEIKTNVHIAENITLLHENEILKIDTICMLLSVCDSIKITGPKTICTNQPAIFTANKYNANRQTNWAFNTTLQHVYYANDTAINLSWPEAGTYKIKASIFGCSLADSVTVNVVPSDTLYLGNDTMICAPNYSIITSPNFSNYLWNTGQQTSAITVATAGQYWVRATNLCGYTVSDTINIRFAAKAAPVWLGNDTSLCNGDSILLTVNNDYKQISWNTGEHTNQISVKKSGKFMVLATDLCNNIYADTIHVGLFTLMPPLYLGGDTIICYPESITLGTKGYENYKWSTGENTPNIQVKNAGQYWLTATDSCRQIFSDSINVLVGGINKNWPNDTAICVNSTLLIGQPSGFTAYSWQPSIGVELDGTNWMVSPTTNTNYIVLTTDSLGCTISKNWGVLVLPCSNEIWIPTAFSPNGDGLNDLFGAIVISSQQPKLFELKVWNRWGQLVFETKNIQQKWNGKYKNRMVNGSFVWQCKYQMSNRQVQDIKGSVLVVQ